MISGSMLEDLGVDVDAYMRDMGYTAQERILQKEQERKPPIVGKFYGDSVDTQEAFHRFILFNAHQIQEVNKPSLKIVMKDGTKYYFRTIGKFEDVCTIAGNCFYSVDVDRKITDERTLNYILSRVRWPYPV